MTQHQSGFTLACNLSVFIRKMDDNPIWRHILRNVSVKTENPQVLENLDELETSSSSIYLFFPECSYVFSKKSVMFMLVKLSKVSVVFCTL